jgi:hypothetical protein
VFIITIIITNYKKLNYKQDNYVTYTLVLLSKMKFYGITDTANKLIESDLRNRYQTVVINDKLNKYYSEWEQIRHGVPQGSVLGSSVISSDLKHRANDARDGSSSYSNRHDQSGLNGCCTAMWKANGKTTTLSLFLDSLFPKTEIPCMQDAWRQKSILSFEGESSRSHQVEESFWKRLWTCRLTDY